MARPDRRWFLLAWGVLLLTLAVGWLHVLRQLGDVAHQQAYLDAHADHARPRRVRSIRHHEPAATPTQPVAP